MYSVRMRSLLRPLPDRAAARLTAALLMGLAAPALHSQARYEVVSIRPAAPGQMNSGFSDGPQGGMRARNVTAQQALAFAYNVQDYQILGAPGWARSERFEISFTPDRSEIAPGERTPAAELDGWLNRHRQRMQAVLRDRFEAAVREETRELPAYVLTVLRNGHKLSRPAHPDRTQSMNVNGGRQIVATTATMKSLAQMLAMTLGRPVRDETGLDGTYDFQMEWEPDPSMPLSSAAARAGEGVAGGPSLFTALTEKLGLRLESRKSPVMVLVVDRLERPSEN